MGQVLGKLNKGRESLTSSSITLSSVADITLRIVLVGAGESGKTTIFKQLEIIYTKDFNQDTLPSRKSHVINGFNYCFVEFLKAIESEHGIIKEEDEDFLNKVEKYFSYDLSKLSKFLNTEMASIVKEVWDSEFGRETWKESAKYGLIESLEFFCKNIDRISSEGYVPTEEDYLLTKIKTTGVQEMTFRYKDVDLFIIDTGGQESERRKWPGIIVDINTVIYVVSLASFDKVLHENSSKDRLVDSIFLFGKIVNSTALRNVPVIFFLNKEDILEQKIRVLVENGRDLDEVFPGLGLGNNYEKCEEKVKEYLKQKFLKVVKDDKIHMVYPHFISATKRDNFLKVFDIAITIVLKAAVNRTLLV